MNSAAPPSQTKCNGFLSWEQQSSTSEIDTTCWGVASALKGAYVNLVEHHDSRPSKPSPDAVLHSLSCLGSAIYQSQPDKRTVRMQYLALLLAQECRSSTAAAAGVGDVVVCLTLLLLLLPYTGCPATPSLPWAGISALQTGCHADICSSSSCRPHAGRSCCTAPRAACTSC